ncbi:MAG: hypothetical protein ACN23H_01125 [Candidatus Phytoplasma vitis]|nr:MAG: hypothetical protein M6G77_01000 [Candidatus Phytoplasma vitis]
MQFNYEKTIKAINEIIIECSFYVNKWIKDLRKLKEDGFRNIFSISLNMRLNRNGKEKIYTINNESLYCGGRTDISIQTEKDYQFQYIIEVKIYKSKKDIDKAFYQIAEYINNQGVEEHASIIMINKDKNSNAFYESKKNIKKYFEKDKERFKILETNEKNGKSIKLELYFCCGENIKYNICFYYVNFYGKQMNEPHIKNKESSAEQIIVSKDEFKLIKKYVLGLLKNTNKSPNIITQKDKYLNKIYKNQKKSLKYTESIISKLEKIKENKDIEFLNKQKEINTKDIKILKNFEDTITEYLEKLYVIKDDKKTKKQLIRTTKIKKFQIIQLNLFHNLNLIVINGMDYINYNLLDFLKSF